MNGFFFNDTATTEIYTLSLHDALPIWRSSSCSSTSSSTSPRAPAWSCSRGASRGAFRTSSTGGRSEEHTSELQSRQYLVCRLLLEKKKKTSSSPILSYASFFSLFTIHH